MATCKDCLHEKVCDALIKSGCPYLDEEIPADAFCMVFKNKADLVPKSEGEWVSKELISKSKRGRTIHYATYKCSVCGKWNGKHKQNYCPNCGAKMKRG